MQEFKQKMSLPTEAFHLRHGIHASIHTIVPPNGNVTLKARSRTAIYNRYTSLCPTFDGVSEVTHAQLPR